MEPQIQDTNAAPVEPAKAYVSDTNAIKAQLQAEIQAKREAANKATVPSVPAATVTTEAPTQTVSTPPVAKAPDQTKPDSMQQFRDKDGQVSPEKIEKANEHLQNGIQDRETRIQQLLKLNKELRREHREKSVQVKTLESEPPKNGVVLDKQAILDRLNNDPVTELEQMIEARVKAAVTPLQEKLSQKEMVERELAMADSLDKIGQKGNPWVYTPEGTTWFEERFQEEPALRQMRDPYAAAIGLFSHLLPSSMARQPDAAPSVRSTPTLGGGHAVPPPSSAPTETPEQQLKKLRSDYDQAMKIRDIKTASELLQKMKHLDARQLVR
jgi:hypothetical protein